MLAPTLFFLRPHRFLTYKPRRLLVAADPPHIRNDRGDNEIHIYVSTLYYSTYHAKQPASFYDLVLYQLLPIHLYLQHLNNLHGLTEMVSQDGQLRFLISPTYYHLFI